MSETGWLKSVLSDAKSDFEKLPGWMQNSEPNCDRPEEESAPKTRQEDDEE